MADDGRSSYHSAPQDGFRNVEIEAAKLRRIRWRLFLAAWIAYAFFHQGGGWSQNARFAMVRAIVEQGSFAIDDFVAYGSVDRSSGRARLVRADVDQATFQLNGRRMAMAWPGSKTPIDREAGEARVLDIGPYIATGDLAYARGRFQASRAPGAALLGVPAYFFLHAIERLAGLDADDWWMLTVNAWLTTAFSVGVVSALGVVAFHASALAVWSGRLGAVTWATVAFAFGTLYFPYATMLYDHDVVAACLLGGFALLARPLLAREVPSRTRLLVAGAVLGWAALSAYAATVPVAMLVGWVLLRSRRLRDASWLAAGLAVPFGVSCVYHAAAFGGVFTTSHAFQRPGSEEAGSVLAALGPPRLSRLAGVLFSPFRGLFFSSPVLLAGVAGLVALARGRTGRLEAWMAASITAFFVALVISLEGWHGGWGVGPRLLIPAVPFLALGLPWAFERWFRTTTALAAVSMLTMLIFTAVDPQSPVGTSPIAERPGRPGFLRDPLTEYALPLFIQGRLRSMLDEQYATAVERRGQELLEEGFAGAEHAKWLRLYEEGLAELIEQGDAQLPLSLMYGPVSAHPIGVYESWFGHAIRPPAVEHVWNAFNAGELLIPRSRLSLLFLLLLAGPLVTSALGAAVSDGICVFGPDSDTTAPIRGGT
jgi:hypothetical protein